MLLLHVGHHAHRMRTQISLPDGAADRFVHYDKVSEYNYSVAARAGKLLHVNATWVGSLPGTNSSSVMPTTQLAFLDDLVVGPPPAGVFDIPEQARRFARACWARPRSILRCSLRVID